MVELVIKRGTRRPNAKRWVTLLERRNGIHLEDIFTTDNERAFLIGRIQVVPAVGLTRGGLADGRIVRS